MAKKFQIAIILLLTLIFWLPASVGVVTGLLMRRRCALAFCIALCACGVLLWIIWSNQGWLPIKAVWRPYDELSDIVVIVVCSFVAGLYSIAVQLARTAYLQSKK